MTLYREHYSRGGKRVGYDRKTMVRSNFMPYGIWKTKTGEEVLFSRFYEPLFIRQNGQVRDADPLARIAWISQDYYYSDAVSDADRYKRAKAVMDDWGLPIPTAGMLVRVGPMVLQ